MASFPVFSQSKDPDDIRDYSIDWADELSTGVTISTAVWTVPEGDVEVDESSISGSITQARISGGTLGAVQLVQCRITTSAGEQFDRSRYIEMRSA